MRGRGRQVDIIAHRRSTLKKQTTRTRNTYSLHNNVPLVYECLNAKRVVRESRTSWSIIEPVKETVALSGQAGAKEKRPSWGRPVPTSVRSCGGKTERANTG